ncbi:BREX-1 system adenine-specific DNA-methyltransferase PglX [Streptomyces sp. SHP 1-2]|uniref:BREX-1 system adenine-specific DNA-methyltransferase PglX n=1 Tax=Streptomyces sp. SHP 1-2 TaxID=2769489 RepID=UPI0022390B65|nr:BREX-1 system adenine-specific DNA-methyltransferase PglX [Streptomyces sp. SHP 1-2]MCW5251752.1 BREX-1 system adenine-specific DNA-methyltransferase PglX [Streptomyces sp. SHP 1-2]
METAPLKSFATWARSALIREVAARVAVVLAPASPERVERRGAVAALERAVAAAGGGEKGRAAVADRVAYTWFNRVVALRFMDARGYTGVGVVSAGRDGAAGQPEILAEAKRGSVDGAVVGPLAARTVTDLLDGTRRSDDPQGEAYALLLAEYCRHWNRSMPFMFEREGDYTELLIPANLLADDSVLARAAAVLTPEVCEDVEVIGWLYQFYISERKDEVFAGFKRKRKAGAAEIPAATQLFTPHWIVRYLVENSLGRIWLLNRPDSRLADRMEHYIAPDGEQGDHPRIGGPEELRIIDPACGSGHLLTYAFDLLYAIYEEEGYAPSDIPGLILTHNLHGTEIDPRAGALAAFALSMKGRARQRTFFAKGIEPGIRVLEPHSFTRQELDLLLTAEGPRAAEEAFWNQFADADVLGSLIRPDEKLTARLAAHLASGAPDGDDLMSQDVAERAHRVVAQAEALLRQYTVVVANPPYMGARSFGPELTAFAKRVFPRTRHDLYAMFIERAFQLVAPRGSVAMVTMQTWMFLSAYEAMRKELLAANRPTAFAHLGTRAFGAINGEVVSTAAFVVEAGGAADRAGTFVRLTAEGTEAAKDAALRDAAAGRDASRTFLRSSGFFLSLPGAPLAYWLDDALAAAFALPVALRTALRPKIGMRTGDNERFLRRWYEVSHGGIGRGCESADAAVASGRRWFPYHKGGGLRRWYGNQDFVVDWFDDGRDIKAATLAAYPQLSPDNLSWKISNEEWYFRPGVTWSDISTSGFAARHSPAGFLFDVKGSSGFPDGVPSEIVLALLNSRVTHEFTAALNPSTTIQVGDLAKIPFAEPSAPDAAVLVRNARRLVEIARADWDASETSWDFTGFGDRIARHGRAPLPAFLDGLCEEWAGLGAEARELELENEAVLNRTYGYTPPDTATDFTRFTTESEGKRAPEWLADLVSYAVGCMFGRYSLDVPGLVLADQGATLRDYLAKVPEPSFPPEKDNVIPIVGGDWFEDDIAARFRRFLRTAFGDEHFEENLRFVTASLGVGDLRDYFLKSFYKDHVQRYRKRPLYWMFSSPKGSFNALVYAHRYTPSTVSTVLNEYLREYRGKLEAGRRHHEGIAAGAGTARERAAAQKETDRLRKVLLELDSYEHDVLYPLATQQVRLDLDDGVRANYPRLGAALRRIPGLEAGHE